MYEIAPRNGSIEVQLFVDRFRHRNQYTARIGAIFPEAAVRYVPAIDEERSKLPG